MARFTRAELEAFRDAEVPDLLGPDVRLLFVGINPGLWTAATRTHFAHPGNRFYPALLAAGILTEPVDPAAGMTDEDRRRVLARGLGITNLVRRATARADELGPEELRAGGEQLATTVARVRPRVVAVAGITAYRGCLRRTPGGRRAAAGTAVRGRALGGAQPERAQRARDRRLPRPGVRRAGARGRHPLTCAGLIPRR